jgi:hypothetical protein
VCTYGEKREGEERKRERERERESNAMDTIEHKVFLHLSH